RLIPEQNQRAEDLIFDQYGNNNRRACREDFCEKRARVLMLVGAQYLEHLPAPDGFRKQFENGKLQRGPFENVRGYGRRRAKVREMNLAVVGVKYRKARGLY